MKRITTKLSLTMLGMAMAALLFVSRSEAATSVPLDIRVSINATKSLAIGTTVYNYGALAVAVSSVSSPILVTNDSASLVETYTLQGTNAASTQSGTTWTLNTSAGFDQYALAGVFASTAPADTDSAFASDDLNNAAPVIGTDTVLGNGTHAEAANGVSPTGGSNTRNLWFRIKTPTSVSDTTQRLTTLTLAVQ